MFLVDKNIRTVIKRNKERENDKLIISEILRWVWVLKYYNYLNENI